MTHFDDLLMRFDGEYPEYPSRSELENDDRIDAELDVDRESFDEHYADELQGAAKHHLSECMVALYPDESYPCTCASYGADS